jgi:hypothetical protein
MIRGGLWPEANRRINSQVQGKKSSDIVSRQSSSQQRHRDKLENDPFQKALVCYLSQEREDKNNAEGNPFVALEARRRIASEYPPPSKRKQNRCNIVTLTPF